MAPNHDKSKMLVKVTGAGQFLEAKASHSIVLTHPAVLTSTHAATTRLFTSLAVRSGLLLLTQELPTWSCTATGLLQCSHFHVTHCTQTVGVPVFGTLVKTIHLLPSKQLQRGAELVCCHVH